MAVSDSIGDPRPIAPWAAPTRVDWSRTPPARDGEARRGLLATVAGNADRFAVVDLETTGLYATDRVVEVAVVTLSLDAVVVDEWTTLVNPMRDVGPTSIHGVHARDVLDAPAFHDIADELAARLHGACLVAHNLDGFDARMLRQEFDRVTSLGMDLGRGVDTLTLTGAKLPVACARLGIQLPRWHSALHDARATAHLLALAGGSHRHGAAAVQARGVSMNSTALLPRTRRHVVAEIAWFEFALGTLDLDEVSADERPYLDLLERAVADHRITPDEREALGHLAHELGLSPARQADAHRHFVEALADRALDDGVVTDEEMTHVLAVAALLEVDDRIAVTRTASGRRESVTIRLTPDLRVCFTGEPAFGDVAVSRNEMERHAESLGLIPVGSVARTTDLVVAADPATQSGKAMKAHDLAIPVAAAVDFIDAEPGGAIAAEVARSKRQPLQRCAVCGGVIVLAHGQRRSGERRCAACIAETPPTVRQPGSPARTEAAGEQLTCADCGTTWTRSLQRGRKPTRCANCQ